MHRPPASISAILLAAAFAPLAPAATIFVDSAQALPAGSQDGETWATAFQTLTGGLAAALGGDEIWVAGGSYVPTTGIDEGESFVLKPGVKVLGGFHFGDTIRSQRDFVGNPSILSGEIGDPAVATDNSRNVVRAVTSPASTELDGFIIRDGFADLAPASSGAGLRVTGGAPTIRNCTFENNHSIVGGGAVQMLSSGSMVVGCSFISNSGGSGGGLDAQNTPITLVNCRFADNHAVNGGALRLINHDGSKVTQCVFTGNTADEFGGAIEVSTSDSSITCCTIVGNEATASQGGGGIRLVNGSASALSNSILWGNNAAGFAEQIRVSAGSNSILAIRNDIEGVTPDANGNFSADPLFRDLDGADDLLGTLDDDARLSNRSPCLDRGDSALLAPDAGDLDGDGDVVEPIPLDIDGDARLRDDVVFNLGVGPALHLDLGAAEFHRPGTVICVRPDGRGESGLTWDEAVKSVTIGFQLAGQFGLADPVQVWVAAGTYVPTSGTDRTVSFVPPGSGVAVFGGFAGGEGSLLQRDPGSNHTILSGAIGAAGSSDNSFHVVDFTGDQFLANDVLDGFVITAGNANGDPASAAGGGIRLRFDARPTIRGCTVVGNEALVGGGVSAQSNANATLVNCLISGNQAIGGGGVYSEASLVIRNCTIAANKVDNGGGGIFAVGPNLTTLVNSILHSNIDSSQTGELTQLGFEEGPAYSIDHCLVECFGSSGLFASATATSGGDPRFVGLAGLDDEIGTSDDSAALLAHSPCIDAGTNAAIGEDQGDSDEDGLSDGDPTPWDLLLAARRVDDVGTIDAGDAGGRAPVVDLGAVEFHGTSSGPAPSAADLDGNGQVDGADLGLLLGAFGGDGGTGDLNEDCTIDGADLGLLLGEWTG